MAITVNSTQFAFDFSGTVTSKAASISVPLGHTAAVIVVAASATATLSSVTDSAGNTYVKRFGSTTANAGGQFLYLYDSVAIGTANTAVTANFSSAPGDIGVFVFDLSADFPLSYSDNKTISYTSNGPNTANGLTTSSLSIGSAISGMIVAACFDTGAGTITAGTGFTLASSQAGAGSEYGAFSANHAATFTCSTNNSSAMIMAGMYVEGLGLMASTGSYSYLTNDAILSAPIPTNDFVLLANSGNYGYLGAPSYSDIQLDVAFGTYAYTGQAATLASVANLSLALATGSYGYSGQDAVLFNTYPPLALGTGSYGYSGSTATLGINGFSIAAGTGSYGVTGNAATFSVAGGNVTLALGSGTYSYTGSSAGLNSGAAPIIGQGAPMMMMFKGAMRYGRR